MIHNIDKYFNLLLIIIFLFLITFFVTNPNLTQGIFSFPMDDRWIRTDPYHTIKKLNNHFSI